MRISDWSSDVCSSDLPGCANAVTVCQIGTSSNLGLTRDYGIGPDAKPQTGNSWSIGVDIAPPQVPGLRASLTYWSNKFVDGVNRLEVTQQLYSNALRDRLTIRSEEHTSELQSLMRISYAVFCLKKKKTQKN